MFRETTKNGVKLHKRRCQSLTCNECGKEFVSPDGLRKHSKLHNTPQMVCEVCGKSFRWRDGFIVREYFHL